VERRKNLGLTVKALAGLPGVPLYVVGRETEYAEEVRQLSHRLGVAGRVRFLPGVGTADLAALYRLATVVLYPSLFEGFGIPIVEALFSGAPVVTTRGGVFPEAAGPGSAYVDPHDPEALREVLAGLLEDEGRRAAMREAGRRFAARFTDEAIVEGLFAAYRAARGAAA